LGRGRRAARSIGSDLEPQALRILDVVLHLHQEGDGALPIDHPMVVGKSQIHHRPHDDLPLFHHRPVLDLVHPEHAGLRRVEDRRGHQ
jgi:hypothetical protein